MKFANIAAAAALALASVSTAAIAQNAQVVVGADVFGPQGGVVGQIESVSEQAVVLKTDKHSVPLPPDAFGEGDTGPTITVTREQLNQMMDDQLAAVEAQKEALMVAGTPITGGAGNVIGSIKEIDGDNVVITGDLGEFSLPKSAFVVRDNGLMTGITAAQIQEQLGGAQG